jgi:hypothetical protein
MAKIYLTFCLINSLLFVRCRKPCQADIFAYSGADLFYPEKDSMRVGDTLFLSCIIIKSDLPDHVTHAENLGGNLIISSIDSFLVSSRGAVAQFDYVNLEGSLYTLNNTSPGNVKQVQYLETDSSFNLKVGLVTLRSGLYIFTFTDVPGVRWSGPGKCVTGNMFFANINANKHLNLIEDKFGMPLSMADSITGYCIKVN